MSDAGKKEDRGPGAKKDSLDRKLQHNAEMERKAKDKDRKSEEPTEEQIDEAIEDSFPASDPPAHSSPTR